MKGNKPQNNTPHNPVHGHEFRPDIRDDLDSRKNEEQDSKGDDTTHNRKEKKTGHLKDKGKDHGR